MQSKQAIGRMYRAKTMMFLARAGYATTRQIARAVIGSCDTSGRKMAGRTLRSLRKLGYLVEKRDGDSVAGEQMVALNRAGAAALAEFAALPDGRAHARDWLRHAHKHRTACNSVFAAMLRGLDEDPGWTELEIRAGACPKELSTYQFTDSDGNPHQKIPDLILRSETGLVWTEVENAWRGARDLQKLVSFLRQLFRNHNPPVEQVWFVVTAPVAKTIGNRLQAALTHGLDSGMPRQIRELDAHILKSRLAVFQLDRDLLQLSPSASNQSQAADCGTRARHAGTVDVPPVALPTHVTLMEGD